MNIVKVEDKISQTIENYLKLENCSDGLLSDVEQIHCSNYNDEGLDTPCVWIYEHPTTTYREANLDKQMILCTPYEFICIDYDDDLVIAQRKAKKLALLVCASVLKNHHINLDPIDTSRIFMKIELDTLYPMGLVQIQGKNEKTPAASLRLKFYYMVDWLKCCKKSNTEGD